MRIYSSLIAAACILGLSQAAVVTQIDYVTKYQYEQVKVIVDLNGRPYSTETVTLSEAPGATSVAPVVVSTVAVAASTPSSQAQAVAAAPTTSTYAAAPASSHVHVDSATNYESISETPVSSSSEAPAAPVTTSAAQPIAPAAPVTTSTPAVETSSSAPAAPVAPQPTTSTTPVAPQPTTSTTPAAITTSSSSPAPAATSSSSSGSGSGSEFSGDATFYDVGLGACGVTNNDNELIAALNVDQFNGFGSMSNGNPVCGKTATLHYQGKSVTVTIQDKCPGCKYGDLDLSPAAFKQLADEGAGRIQITWGFN